MLSMNINKGERKEMEPQRILLRPLLGEEEHQM
jgi:hypothetical protein